MGKASDLAGAGGLVLLGGLLFFIGLGYLLLGLMWAIGTESLFSLDFVLGALPAAVPLGLGVWCLNMAKGIRRGTPVRPGRRRRP